MWLETVPNITAALLTVHMLRLDLHGFKFRSLHNMLTLHKLDTLKQSSKNQN